MVLKALGGFFGLGESKKSKIERNVKDLDAKLRAELTDLQNRRNSSSFNQIRKHTEWLTQLNNSPTAATVDAISAEMELEQRRSAALQQISTRLERLRAIEEKLAELKLTFDQLSDNKRVLDVDPLSWARAFFYQTVEDEVAVLRRLQNDVKSNEFQSLLRNSLWTGSLNDALRLADKNFEFLTRKEERDVVNEKRRLFQTLRKQDVDVSGDKEIRMWMMDVLTARTMEDLQTLNTTLVNWIFGAQAKDDLKRRVEKLQTEVFELQQKANDKLVLQILQNLGSVLLQQQLVTLTDRNLPFEKVQQANQQVDESLEVAAQQLLLSAPLRRVAPDRAENVLLFELINVRRNALQHIARKNYDTPDAGFNQMLVIHRQRLRHSNDHVQLLRIKSGLSSRTRTRIEPTNLADANLDLKRLKSMVDTEELKAQDDWARELLRWSTDDERRNRFLYEPTPTDRVSREEKPQIPKKPSSTASIPFPPFDNDVYVPEWKFPTSSDIEPRRLIKLEEEKPASETRRTTDLTPAVAPPRPAAVLPLGETIEKPDYQCMLKKYRCYHPTVNIHRAQRSVSREYQALLKQWKLQTLFAL